MSEDIKVRPVEWRDPESKGETFYTYCSYDRDGSSILTRHLDYSVIHTFSKLLLRDMFYSNFTFPI